MSVVMDAGVSDAAVCSDLTCVRDHRLSPPDFATEDETNSADRLAERRQRAVRAVLRLGRLRLRRITFRRRTIVQERVIELLCELLEEQNRDALIRFVSEVVDPTTEAGISLRAASRHFNGVHGVKVSDRTLAALWARIVAVLGLDQAPAPDMLRRRRTEASRPVDEVVDESDATRVALDPASSPWPRRAAVVPVCRLVAPIDASNDARSADDERRLARVVHAMDSVMAETVEQALADLYEAIRADRASRPARRARRKADHRKAASLLLAQLEVLPETKT